MWTRIRRSLRHRGHRALMRVYGPAALRLTRRRRTARWRGLRLTVPAGVFHPGLYFSSHALADELTRRVDVDGRRLLDVGTGSGLLALAAARAGAIATAVDVNPQAAATARVNAARNRLDVEVVVSDLFGALGGRRFDVVVSNPPYFRQDPGTMAERAWHAGADLGWFDAFFAGLAHHVVAGATVLLVLGEHCEIDAVSAAARRHGWSVRERRRVRRALGASVVYDAVPVKPS